MKLSFLNQTGPRRTGASAFTIAEMLIVMTIFSFLVAAMVYTQIFGLHVYTLAATKLSATAGCRKALNQIRSQIQQAKLLNIGNCSGDYTTFSPLGLTNNQVGNAVMVFPPLFTDPDGWDTNNYILFYLVSNTNSMSINTNTLRQYTHTITATVVGTTTNYTTNTSVSPTVLASYITNQDIFTAQDYSGTTLTNEEQLDAIDNRLVVYMKMQFCQWEYPIAYVGTNSGYGNMYDYYQLRTKITRRVWN